MGAYATLYGGIEERLTAAEDLRANGAGAHAMWRFVEESAGTMHSSVRRESAFLRLWWAVQGSVAVGSVVSLVAGASLVSSGVHHHRYRLPHVPVRAAARASAGGRRAATGDRAEGQRCDGARHRPAGHASRRSSTTAPRLPRRGPLRVDVRRTSRSTTATTTTSACCTTSTSPSPPARSVGVVGRTGSGKTTLSRLVLRLGRGDLRRAADRRRAHRRRPDGRTSPPRGDDPPGGGAVHRHHPRQRHPVRPRPHRRAGGARAPPGRAGRAGDRRHPPRARCRRRWPVGRRGATAGTRPRVAARPRSGGARRGHRTRRPRDRGAAGSRRSPS